MSGDVQCPACRAILRPTAQMLADGGERPCPCCGQLLSIAVPRPQPNSPTETARPGPRRSRAARRSQGSRALPPWAWLAVGGGVVLALIVVGGVLLSALGRSLFGPPPIARSEFDKVQAGMTPEQVRALLGKPTRDLETGAAFGALANMIPQPAGQKTPSMRMMVWTDERTYSAAVQFLDDKVVQTIWDDAPPSSGISWGSGRERTPHEEWLERQKDERRRRDEQAQDRKIRDRLRR